MKKLAIDIVLRLTFSKWIRQAFPVSIAFIYCYVSGMPSVGRFINDKI